MDWKSAELIEKGGVNIPSQWLHLYYYEALNVLFRFENALRVFVYVVLKKELGASWDQAALGDGITIRTETRKRLAQAREHGYLGYEVTSPVLYLNSGELTQILVSEPYWKHFAPYFKAAKAVVLNKLQEIGTVCNSLAHFRPVKQDDVELIKQNAKHVLLEIENCLTQISGISDAAPSNMEAAWYKEIQAIGNQYFSTAFFLSKDQKWVRLEMTCLVPTIKFDKFGAHFVMFSVGNMRTSELLKYQTLREKCIYFSEANVSGQVKDDTLHNVRKKVSVVFPIKALEQSYALVATELKEIALAVESETALVLEDNLARGKLIDVKKGTATWIESDGGGRWKIDFTDLTTSVEDTEEVEFWGVRSHWTEDFICATSRYPWMPSSVSTESWWE